MRRVLLRMDAAIMAAAKMLTSEVSTGVGWTKISSSRKITTAMAAQPEEKAFISTGRSETTLPDSPFTTA